MKKREKNRQGAFIVSLDFELLWGVIDKHGPSDYGQTNVKNVESVLTNLIALFEKYEVKATVGYVGMMFYHGKDALLKDLPLVRPTYKNMDLSPYREGYIDGILKENERMYFAPHLVEKLRRSPNIELGSHTYCHYYCNAEGQTIEEFEADIKKAVEQAKAKAIGLKSIIFPRNQVRDEYLAICAKYGFETYRGNPNHFFSNRREPILNKIGRLFDTYFPITKTTYPYEELTREGGLTNVKASRFFRPYSKKMAFLEWLKIHRIKQELKRAARHGEVYHLWWHPHNFGANMEKNLEQLKSVLETFKQCNTKYGMKSYSMQEISTYKNEV